MRPVAQLEFAFHADAPRLETIHFLQDLGWVEDDAAGDHAGDPVAEDAAGDNGKFPGLAAGDDGVARVGTTLVTDDDVVVFRQDVDEFAFGLVSPLQTDDAGAGHCLEVLSTRKRRRREMRDLPSKSKTAGKPVKAAHFAGIPCASTGAFRPWKSLP